MAAAVPAARSASTKVAPKTAAKAPSAGASPIRGPERLQKLLARAGHSSSRRAAEEVIAQGRVSVNGHVVTETGTRADPQVDRILVDGQPLRLPGGPATVLLFHKPTGVVTTRKDPEGRTTVYHYLPEKYRHLHPIGRLDFDTSGVLLLTDDGDLTQLLTHPSHGVEKVYWARVRGTVTLPTIKKLEAGIFLDDGKTSPCSVRVRAQTEKNALVQITLREGRNRQVRRMLDAVGHPVGSLRRVKVGGLGLDEVVAGAFRVLLPGEVHLLRKTAEKPKPMIKARPAKAAPAPRTPRPGSGPPKPRVWGEAGPRPGTRPAVRSGPAAPGSTLARNPAARGATARGTTARGAAPRGGQNAPVARPATGARPAAGATPAARAGRPAPVKPTASRKPPLAQRIDEKFPQQPGQRGARRQWGQKTRKHAD